MMLWEVTLRCDGRRHTESAKPVKFHGYTMVAVVQSAQIAGWSVDAERSWANCPGCLALPDLTASETAKKTKPTKGARK